MSVRATLFLLVALLTACGDPDGDGLSSSEEKALGTDPQLADTDGDGLSDGEEHLNYHTDPLVADSDSDGLSDGAEIDAGTDPLVADSDSDGLSDGDEVIAGTDPLAADSDNDGVPDGTEVANRTDPLDDDTDDDGLSDGREAELGTDPLQQDTDNDGYLDPWEVTEGTDPLDNTSVIYQGGWPYNPDKDALGGKTLEEAPESALGAQLARLKLVDQHGDEVDLYDFFDDGKPVAVAFVHTGDRFARDLGNLVAHGVDDPYPWDGHNVKANVDAGKLHWVWVVVRGGRDQEPTEGHVETWVQLFERDDTPVLLGNHAIREKYVEEFSTNALLLVDHKARITNLSFKTDEADYSLKAINEL